MKATKLTTKTLVSVKPLSLACTIFCHVYFTLSISLLNRSDRYRSLLLSSWFFRGCEDRSQTTRTSDPPTLADHQAENASHAGQLPLHLQST